jgi:hypothetical protein
MADIPLEMMTLEKKPDPNFADHERLFRRFHPDHWEDGGVAAEAFKLPSMSVNREKHGPAKWAIIDEDYETWGVAAFRVDEIPRDEGFLHLGVIVYTLKPEHRPLKYNYPHTEVLVSRDGILICVENRNVDLLDPAFHIRWRERLSQVANVIIQPTEED